MMRSIPLLIAGTILASCTNGPPPPPQPPTPGAMREAQALLGGKVAGPPVDCVPAYDTNNQTVLDGRTLAFRAGAGHSRVYVAHLTPGCEMITSGSYALVSRQVGSMGLCRGDIQQVVDTLSHAHMGACSISDVIPYVRP
jgi:hypothetical protein